MFENLTNKFEEIFSSLKKSPSLDEKQVDEGLRNIRQALLEADVSLTVAKEFIANVKPKALGQEIVRSTSPGQMVVKIVYDELVKLLGENNTEHIGGTAVNVGNPHIVFFVKDIENFDLKKIGPEIENHKLFPEKCNVTLAKVINKNLIKVKAWERGSGLTKACGTAACAAAIAGNINGFVEKKTDIEFKLGKLSIFIDDKNSVHMKGSVSDIKNIEIKI